MREIKSRTVEEITYWMQTSWRLWTPCPCSMPGKYSIIAHYMKKNAWLLTKTPVCIWPCIVTETETEKKMMGRRTKQETGKRCMGGIMHARQKKTMCERNELLLNGFINSLCIFVVATQKLINSKLRLSFGIRSSAQNQDTQINTCTEQWLHVKMSILHLDASAKLFFTSMPIKCSRLRWNWIDSSRNCGA